jgi:transposase-like protein
VKHSQSLPINGIRLDGGTQPRAVLDFDAVEDYAEAMGAGAKFPPLAVFYDGSDYWLADGFHRIKAAYAAGLDTIDCELHQGTLEDAQWYSFSANRANGLRRTNTDKQRAVKAALLHVKSRELSDHQIARHVGIDVKTVGNWRERLSMEIPQISARTVTRGGSTYQQDTTKIGKRKRKSNPSTGNSGTASPANDGASNHLDAIVRAVLLITNCEASAEDLARQLNSRQDRDQLISSMERANDFLKRCATEAREAGRATQPGCQPPVAARADAGDAGTGAAMA